MEKEAFPPCVKEAAMALRGLPHRLVWARYRSSHTQDSLAAAASVRADRIELFEAGKKTPKLYEILKIVQVLRRDSGLNITLGWLVGEVPEIGLF